MARKKTVAIYIEIAATLVFFAIFMMMYARIGLNGICVGDPEHSHAERTERRRISGKSIPIPRRIDPALSIKNRMTKRRAAERIFVPPPGCLYCLRWIILGLRTNKTIAQKTTIKTVSAIAVSNGSITPLGRIPLLRQ